MDKSLQPHIRVGKDIGIQYALLPGDPGRVKTVAEFLDQPKEIAYNREYRSISGSYRGIPILVTSTGIGGASAGIAVEELKNIGVKAMIRIGSCGANQPGIRVGDLIIASGAVRNDGASAAYIDQAYPAVPDTDLLFHIASAAKRLSYSHFKGLVRSHDSFYTDEEQLIDEYWAGKGILASDMETAALFVIGGLRGVKTASILNVVVEKDENLEGGINNYIDGDNAAKLGEEREIRTVLEAIVSFHNSFHS
ncbi:nucleoside phosphorylase [Neobacillus terrae]|uniref:nucleoside phosphorylase n=1 Tax=Neobacillus terrae TaxID=3034837 RepID=UPI0014086A71|nr:nucleoside phosphorylase [Neobacillus terrae]NHM31642.1 nucleoside phosphorylase [Neobacillus terrae]